MKNRIAWLDLFRGVAAVVIVLFHYRDYLGLTCVEWGFVAVDAFFVLSGIVLAMKYTDAIAEGMSFGAFASARLKRLYPAMVIAGVFIVLLDLAGAPANLYMIAGPTGAWSIFVPLVPSVGGFTTDTNAAFPADVPVWSFWAELVANAIWFAVIRGGRRWMPWLGGVAMLILVVYAWTFGSLDNGWQNSLNMRLFSLARALAWFSVGYGIARANGKPVVSPLVATIALAVAVVAFASGLPVTWYAALGAAALCAVLLHALYGAPAPGPVVSGLAKWMGSLSFPLYLVHGPVGRLLPSFSNAWPHAVVLLFLVAPVTVLATVLNERAVRALHQRRPARAAEAAGIDG